MSQSMSPRSLFTVWRCSVAPASRQYKSRRHLTTVRGCHRTVFSARLHCSRANPPTCRPADRSIDGQVRQDPRQQQQAAAGGGRRGRGRVVVPHAAQRPPRAAGGSGVRPAEDQRQAAAPPRGVCPPTMVRRRRGRGQAGAAARVRQPPARECSRPGARSRTRCTPAALPRRRADDGGGGAAVAGGRYRRRRRAWRLLRVSAVFIYSCCLSFFGSQFTKQSQFLVFFFCEDKPVFS